MNKLDDRLKSLHFITDYHDAHVRLSDPDACRNCRDKICLTLCPSGVFTLDRQAPDSVLILYRQCLECGACRLICPNILFSYPPGGYGVDFREG